MRTRLAEMRSVKSFVPIVADHVKGDQLCIPSGINYELSYYYGAAVPDLTNPKCVYLLATPRDLDAMTPRISRAAQARRELQSDRWRRPARAI